MKTRKSKWSKIFDTHCGKLHGYLKSPCQVSEKFIIGKVDCNRGYPSWNQDEQVLLIQVFGEFLKGFAFNFISVLGS